MRLGHSPTPAADHSAFALAGAALVAGVLLLAFALTRLVGDDGGQAAVPPPAPAVSVTVPAPAPAEASPTASTERTPGGQERNAPADLSRFAVNDRAHVRSSWVAGFYGIYEIAQREFGVNWLLLASVHKQETAFSTHPTTYSGLNFARCCAGPMQFNVTNGPTTTWERYRDAFRRAERPETYNNATDRHPSVYDDFDAIMAAAALLRDSGAGTKLDASAWRAAYDYYGHDLTGVDYATQVLARAIGWARTDFCINCATDAGLVGAVDAAWGAPMRTQLAPPPDEDAEAPRAEAARARRSG